MVKERISDSSLNVENVANLNAVTVATNGIAVDVQWYKDKSVFAEVTGNTGAVDVNIEASHDGITWFNLNTTTYTATNATDVRSFTDHFAFMRTTTTTQSSSTVTTIITGRS